MAGEVLTVERARDMLLGRVTTWSDGTSVTIVLVVDRGADAELLALAGRDRQRLLRGWKRLVYSGAGVMPVEAANPVDAMMLVQNKRCTPARNMTRAMLSQK